MLNQHITIDFSISLIEKYTNVTNRYGQRFIVVVKHHGAATLQLYHEVVEIQLTSHRKWSDKTTHTQFTHSDTTD